MKTIVFIVLCCLSNTLFGQAVWNGYTYNAPVCNKPNCAMCNAIRAQLAAQQQQVQVQVTTPVVSNDQYVTTYETRAVTRQVKRCNGRTCWFENVTEYVQVPVTTKVQQQVTVPQLTINKTPAKKNISLDLVPTPEDAIPTLVSLLRPTESDVFIEPGCGDGRVLIAVSRICPSIGIELNPDTARLAQENISKDATIYRRKAQATILVGDATQADYTRATLVSMYLYPDVMEKIVPLLQPGTRIVSYCHTIPGIKCTEHTTNGHTFYVGIK